MPRWTPRPDAGRNEAAPDGGSPRHDQERTWKGCSMDPLLTWETMPFTLQRIRAGVAAGDPFDQVREVVRRV